MTRPIDADALDSVVLRMNTEGAQITRGEYKLIDSVIFEFPTIDAVPVIRCCDCVHFKYFENQFFQMTRCDVHDRCPNYTDFCSWAERKEE